MSENDGHSVHDHPKSTARIGTHPIHPMLVPFPIVCFIGALVSDLVHVGGWANTALLSSWLLGIGLAFAALAAAAGLTDFLGDRVIRSHSDAVKHMLANVTVVVIEAVNLASRLDDPGFLRSTGVYLSALAVLILLYSGWKGGELVFRHGIGVLHGSGRHSGRTLEASGLIPHLRPAAAARTGDFALFRRSSARSNSGFDRLMSEAPAWRLVNILASWARHWRRSEWCECTTSVGAIAQMELPDQQVGTDASAHRLFDFS